MKTKSDTHLSENMLKEKEAALILREENLRQREIEVTAHEVAHHKAMADLKEEKLTYQCLNDELRQQKALLIQLCKDIEIES